jgi:putative restriction endonuclease
VVKDSVQLRLAAFAYLDELLLRGPYVTRDELRAFSFNGTPFPLISGSSRGIYKPEGWTTVMSILSSGTPAAKGGYEDEYREDGTLLYRFMTYSESNIGAYNRALLETLDQRLPLILLQKMKSSLFEPFYPVWIEGRSGDAVIVGGQVPDTEIGEIVGLAAEVKKRYATVIGKRRLHQDLFRSQLLFAYGDRCAVCNLGRRGLLDAAHIIDDAEDRGEPVIQNGLALCRIHHGAYDQFLIGIRPDLRIEVAEDVIAEVDGPMLEHGLKKADGLRIRVPETKKLHPDPENLQWKYEKYLARR